MWGLPGIRRVPGRGWWAVVDGSGGGACRDWNLVAEVGLFEQVPDLLQLRSGDAVHDVGPCGRGRHPRSHEAQTRLLREHRRG